MGPPHLMWMDSSMTRATLGPQGPRSAHLMWMDTSMTWATLGQEV